MKKITCLFLLSSILASCGSSSLPSSSSLEPSSSSLSSSIPNGLQPLVPYEDCDVPTLDGGWVAQWADEFNGTSLDTTKWNYEVNGDGGGNNEAQYYRSENVAVSEGLLTISAKKESYLGKAYTSGRINTRYRANWLYGRIKVRAKMPSGRGTWPAIWMMPLYNVYGVWPKSGEMDIMEYVGYNPNTGYSTVHTEKFNGKIGTQIGASFELENAETSFHDYELIWDPGSMKTYVDGVKKFEYRYAPAFNLGNAYPECFPFDQEFFLILNLAIGGNWGGSQGIDENIFPATLQIDYARVYRRDYAVVDKETPQTPSGLSLATLENTIYWVESSDDFGVEKYAIYLDGVFYRTCTMNQFTFKTLTSGQVYAVQIKAIDFVGHESGLSNSFSLSYS